MDQLAFVPMYVHKKIVQRTIQLSNDQSRSGQFMYLFHCTRAKALGFTSELQFKRYQM